jgi:murein L,D-transpeptidase YcbB/YkuD
MKSITKLLSSCLLLTLPALSNSTPTDPKPSPQQILPLPVPEPKPSVKSAFQQALVSLPAKSEDSVRIFYNKMGNEPVWFFQGNLTKCGQVAVDTLHKAALDGLSPGDYQDAVETADHPTNWTDAEILLTRRFLDYIDHVRSGRIDPQKISHEIKFHSLPKHAAEILFAALTDKTHLCSNLRHMGPNIPQYAHLKEILANYRLLAKENPEWPTLGNTTPLKLGDDDPKIKTLRKILFLLGDLKEEEGTSTVFDKDLDLALRQFQKRNTLEADGVVGGKTKDALNQPIDSLIRKVLLNMERLRWLPQDLGQKHIIVNVAGYEVRAYENADLKLTIPAIIGRPSRRTPLFYATLKNVVVNPSWGVPYNILVHDKIPKIINDPDYVRRSGFTVTDDSGNVIDADQADWENEGSHYHLRQSPGRHNALGRVKFNIENPYTIYLHGTPEEKLFQKTARPFSSGCIRLKAPVDLAVWALDNKEKWSDQNLELAINKGSTQTVKPENDIGVYFTYQTVWLGDGGLVHISDDPYRMDAKMEKVLHSTDFS